jgi:hypothetical protein
MKKIYRESFQFFRASLPALLLLGFMLEAAIWFLQPRSESSISMVVLIFIAYYFHRHFLFDEPFGLRNQKLAPGAPPFKFGWFMLVSLPLLLVPVGLVVWLMLGYYDRPSTGDMILAYLPIYLVTLGLFGTALPATVARDGTYRLTQGLRVSLQTMWRLVLGPGVIGFVLLVATVLADRALDSLGVSEDSLIMLAYLAVQRTLGFLTTIFAVAVLCEMYRRSRPVGPGPEGQETGPQSKPKPGPQTPA